MAPHGRHWVVSLHLGEHHGSIDFICPTCYVSGTTRVKKKFLVVKASLCCIRMKSTWWKWTWLCYCWLVRGRWLCPGTTRHCPSSWPGPLNTPINGKYLSWATVLSLPPDTQLCTHTACSPGPLWGSHLEPRLKCSLESGRTWPGSSGRYFTIITMMPPRTFHLQSTLQTVINSHKTHEVSK